MMALDTDKNGEISAKEIQNAAAALKKLDKNGDGKLTRDELRPQHRRPGGPDAGRPPHPGRPDAGRPPRPRPGDRGGAGGDRPERPGRPGPGRRPAPE